MAPQFLQQYTATIGELENKVEDKTKQIEEINAAGMASPGMGDGSGHVPPEYSS